MLAGMGSSYRRSRTTLAGGPLRVLLSSSIALVWLVVSVGAAAQPAADPWFDEGDATTSEVPPQPGAGEPAPVEDAELPPEPEAPAIAEEPAEAEEALDEEAANERAVENFSPHLAPHGVWVDDSVYGRVWVPYRRVVGVGFSPYVSGGHWELTVYDDWLWVSDYPFGWITFHYGNWVWLSRGHWAWVPGYRWAPAWVDFRVGSSAGYVGWGPSAPTYVWRHGVFVSFGAVSAVPFVFCSSRVVFAPTLERHVIRDRYRVRQIALETSRYRTRRIYGSAVVRAPSAREARIPAASLPARRVVGRPRSVEQRYYVERSAERRGVQRRLYEGSAGAGRRYVAPSHAAPSRAAPSRAAPSRAAPSRAAPRERRDYRAPAGNTRQRRDYGTPPANTRERRGRDSFHNPYEDSRRYDAGPSMWDRTSPAPRAERDTAQRGERREGSRSYSSGAARSAPGSTARATTRPSRTDWGGDGGRSYSAGRGSNQAAPRAQSRGDSGRTYTSGGRTRQQPSRARSSPYTSRH
jgi:hypothetical protein